MQTSHLTSTTLKSVTEGSQGAWVAAWELLIGSRKSKNWELVSSSAGVKQQGVFWEEPLRLSQLWLSTSALTAGHGFSRSLCLVFPVWVLFFSPFQFHHDLGNKDPRFHPSCLSC